MSDCTVYIDEAGDLGYRRGTQWFVLTAVIVSKKDEPRIRAKLASIKARLNVNEIHLRKINDFYRRTLIVREIAGEEFTYINIIADTNMLDILQKSSAATAYNYLCRLLLERVSWFLRDTNQTADVVLSARGTSRDGELINYIKEKLLPYAPNEISPVNFEKITAKTSGSWDMLQLADICATTMFLFFEKNGWGFRTPCFSKVLKPHLYKYNGKINHYGIKYVEDKMALLKTDAEYEWPCKK